MVWIKTNIGQGCLFVKQIQHVRRRSHCGYCPSSHFLPSSGALKIIWTGKPQPINRPTKDEKFIFCQLKHWPPLGECETSWTGEKVRKEKIGIVVFRYPFTLAFQCPLLLLLFCLIINIIIIVSPTLFPPVQSRKPLGLRLSKIPLSILWGLLSPTTTAKERQGFLRTRSPHFFGLDKILEHWITAEEQTRIHSIHLIF